MLRRRVNELITVLEREEERKRVKSHGKQTEKAKRREGMTEDGITPKSNAARPSAGKTKGACGSESTLLRGSLLKRQKRR